MTVGELGQRMGSRELEGWKRYHGVTAPRDRGKAPSEPDGLAMFDKFYGIR
jgi:hypothetical protein